MKNLENSLEDKEESKKEHLTIIKIEESAGFAKSKNTCLRIIYNPFIIYITK